MTGGKLLAFRRPLRLKPPATPQRVTGFAITLEAHQDAVLIIAHDTELGLTPCQARELAANLLECADDAEARS